MTFCRRGNVDVSFIRLPALAFALAFTFAFAFTFANYNVFHINTYICTYICEHKYITVYMYVHRVPSKIRSPFYTCQGLIVVAWKTSSGRQQYERQNGWKEILHLTRFFFCIIFFASLATKTEVSKACHMGIYFFFFCFFCFSAYLFNRLAACVLWLSWISF